MILLLLLTFFSCSKGVQHKKVEDTDYYRMDIDIEKDSIFVKQTIDMAKEYSDNGNFNLLFYPLAFTQEFWSADDRIPKKYATVTIEKVYFEDKSIDFQKNNSYLSIKNIESTIGKKLYAEYYIDLPKENLVLGLSGQDIYLNRFYLVPTVDTLLEYNYKTPNIRLEMAKFSVSINNIEGYNLASNNDIKSVSGKLIIEDTARECWLYCSKVIVCEQLNIDDVAINYYHKNDIDVTARLSEVERIFKACCSLFREYPHKNLSIIKGAIGVVTPIEKLVIIDEKNPQQSFEEGIIEEFFCGIDSYREGYFLEGIKGFGYTILPLVLGDMSAQSTRTNALKQNMIKYQNKYVLGNENTKNCNLNSQQYGKEEYSSWVKNVNALRLIFLSEIISYNKVLGGLQTCAKSYQSFGYEDFIKEVQKTTKTDCKRLLSSFDNNKFLLKNTM